jgi:hypothetical protein
MRGDNEMNARIDAALRSYADPGEIPEAHAVLACIRERAEVSQTRRQWLRLWMIPVAGAAALIVLIVLWTLHSPTSPQIAWTPAPLAVAQPPQSEVENSSLPRQPSAAQTTISHTVARSRPLPKQPLFPTPGPLSPEERQLVAFASQIPPDAAKQLADAQQHIDDPIRISPITIHPLDEDEPTDQPAEQPNGKDHP